MKNADRLVSNELRTAELLARYDKVRAHSIELCAPLALEDYIPQPRYFASPPKWHLAHTTWFFEAMVLKPHFPDYREYHPQFSYLFNSYYKTIGDRAMREERGAMTRPSVDKVKSYRSYVDAAVKSLVDDTCAQEILRLVELGTHHEQQHQELLLTDLKHTFSLNPIFPVYESNSNRVADHNEQDGWLPMQEGIYEIGHKSNEFCFDNELNGHRVYLHEYDISKAYVTNGEYIKFIEAGGYKDFRYWLEDGHEWVKSQKIDRPLYWFKIDDAWHYFTLAGLQPVDPDAILAHVSYYEAHAYATWKDMRLPTEQEWEAACDQLEHGKRWEWTESAYLPYPGFKIAEGAAGEYNGKFMINNMVLRGGSVATPAEHFRYTYRNFFHPEHRWQYTGIRLAK